MRVWHRLSSRARSFVFRRRCEADLGEELALHLDREIERLVSLGMPRDEARRHARRTFGGVDQIKEGCRDARGTAGVDAAMRDVQYAVRRLRRDWRFTAAAVLILGLGIGANTAIFSLIDAVLLRGQPTLDPERVVDIYQRGINPEGIDANSYPAYLDMAAYNDVFASAAAASVPRGVNYRDGAGLKPAVVENTTATYLAVLGLRPSLGRWFEAAEDVPGAPVVAVLSHDAWTRKFNADPSIVGREVQIEGVPVTIVGVGPAGYRGTLNVGVVTDFWLPIGSLAAIGAPSGLLERRPLEAGFFVKARLRDGVTVAQAQAAMNILGTRLAADYPREDPGRGIAVYASGNVRVHPQMDALLAPVAAVLLGVVSLVLAIACSNLATLLLVRGTARAKEVSIRLAVGATRLRLVLHLLTESVLLAAAGGVVGCVLAAWAIRILSAIELPVAVDLSLDYRVLAFAIFVSLLTGVTFGLAPALKATRLDLVSTLRDAAETPASDHRWLTLKNTLVVIQVMVSVLLLGITSLFLQLLTATRGQPAGFNAAGIAMVETDARYAGYSAAAALNMFDELQRRVAAIPGVQSVVLAHGLPMRTDGIPVALDDELARDAGGAPVHVAGAIWAGPGYFALLRIPILFGRAIDERDREGTPRVAVISETMAKRLFGRADAVGRRFRVGRDRGALVEVVGIAADTGTADRQSDLVDPQPELFYRAFAQSNLAPTAVLARTPLDATTLAAAMQRELRAVNPALPVLTATTLAQNLEDSLRAPKAIAMFFAGLGVLGLTLAGIGLYAVVAFAVTRRSREIGIRLALGADRRQVVWTVARELVAIVCIGTAAGVLLSLAAIAVIRSVSVSTPGVALYRPSVDPVALAAIAGFMALVGAAAAYGPARRASRLNPLVALRHD